MEVLQWVDEVLFDLHVQSVLHLPELLHRLTGIDQRQAWKEWDEGGKQENSEKVKEDRAETNIF